VIKDNKGQEIATGTVNSDGSFKVNLKNPTNGSDIKVGLVDGSGNKSPEVTKSTPDKVAPDAPTNLSVGSDGKSVSGKGEPGAKVVIKNNKGQEIATGTVNSDGSFKVNLKNPTNGSDIKVGLVDGSGNKSPEVTKSTPDKVAPDAPTNLSVGSDGKSVSGNGESNAKVIIKNSGGTVIATGVVNSNGNFKVNLKNPTNGRNIKVGLEDAAGNKSPEILKGTPDKVAPNAPTDLVVSNDAKLVSGKGEPGATVQIRNSEGIAIGKGIVGANGLFKIPITIGKSQSLSVTLKDKANNQSRPGSVFAKVPAPEYEIVYQYEKKPQQTVGMNIQTGPALRDTARANFTIAQKSSVSNIVVSMATNGARGTAQLYNAGKLLASKPITRDSAIVFTGPFKASGTYQVVIQATGTIRSANVRYVETVAVPKKVLKPRMARALFEEDELNPDLESNRITTSKIEGLSLDDQVITTNILDDTEGHAVVDSDIEDNFTLDEEVDYIDTDLSNNPIDLTEEHVDLEDLLDLAETELKEELVNSDDLYDLENLEDLIIEEDAELVQLDELELEESESSVDEEILDETNALVDSSDFDVQPVVDPLNDLLDPN
ncbi:Ig-like domain-containing protein, partial [Ignatzschineria indica]